MRNFNSYLVGIILIVFLFGCEIDSIQEPAPENAKMLKDGVSDLQLEENNSYEKKSYRKSSTKTSVVSSLTCSIDFKELSSFSSNTYADIGVIITDGPRGTTSDRYLIYDASSYPSVYECLSQKSLLHIPGTGPSYLVQFSEPQEAVSIISGDLGEDADLLVLTAYSGINGDGDVIDSETYYLDAGVYGCGELTVRGSGINSVELTSQGDFPNSVYVGSISWGDCVSNTSGDTDGDGFIDELDNCPLVSNPNQEDNDGDGLGDACDPDDDNDGVNDGEDNCEFHQNPLQEDFDGDGLGDACDPDDDNDGVVDEQDAFPKSNLETTVIIGDCDSGVQNDIYNDGSTLSDLVDVIENQEFKNYGQYKRAFTELLNQLEEENLITEEEQDLIMGCGQGPNN